MFAPLVGSQRVELRHDVDGDREDGRQRNQSRRDHARARDDEVTSDNFGGEDERNFVRLRVGRRERDVVVDEGRRSTEYERPQPETDARCQFICALQALSKITRTCLE
jgi:hypothetical protein